MADAPAPPPAATPLPGSLEWLAAERPGDVALIDGPRTCTRAQWNQRADALAAGLAAEHDIGAGDRIAVYSANRLELFELALALAKLGATPVAIDRALPASDAAALAGSVDATLALTDDDGYDGLRLGDAYEALVARHDDATPRLSGTHPTPTSVTFTATSPPRPVLRTFDPGRATATAAALGDLLARTHAQPGDVHLMAAPNHLFSPALHANLALMRAGRVVVQPTFDPEAWLALVDEEGVTSAWLTPAMLRALTALPPGAKDRYDTSPLNAAIIGAATIDAELAAAAADLLGEDVLVAVPGDAEADAIWGPANR